MGKHCRKVRKTKRVCNKHEQPVMKRCSSSSSSSSSSSCSSTKTTTKLVRADDCRNRECASKLVVRRERHCRKTCSSSSSSSCSSSSSSSCCSSSSSSSCCSSSSSSCCSSSSSSCCSSSSSSCSSSSSSSCCKKSRDCCNSNSGCCTSSSSSSSTSYNSFGRLPCCRKNKMTVAERCEKVDKRCKKTRRSTRKTGRKVKKVYGRVFHVTLCDKNLSPHCHRISDCNHSFSVGGQCSKILHLRRGNTYIFKFECVAGYSFLLTSDPAGGRGCAPLFGTPIIRGGESLTVTITEQFPTQFYYHCLEYEFLGGQCQVHN